MYTYTLQTRIQTQIHTNSHCLDQVRKNFFFFQKANKYTMRRENIRFTGRNETGGRSDDQTLQKIEGG